MEPAETLAGLRLLHSNLLSNRRLGRLLSGNRIRPTELSGLPVSGFDGLRLSACDVASIRQLSGRSARPYRTDPAQALLTELTRQQVTVLGQSEPAQWRRACRSGQSKSDVAGFEGDPQPDDVAGRNRSHGGQWSGPRGGYPRAQRRTVRRPCRGCDRDRHKSLLSG